MKNYILLQKVTIAFTLLILATYSSCKKDDTVPSTTSENFSNVEDFEQSEQIASDADNMADMAYTTGDVNLRMALPDLSNTILSCASVVKDTVAKIITIDFGSGCMGNDGRFRSGQIIIHYNGHYFDPGFSRSVTFSNFYVDSNHVEGTRSITNNGLNTNGNLNWTIVADSMRVTKPNGYYHEWNSTRNREMINGSTTPSIVLDDIYLITGTATGSNSNGHSVMITITSALRKEMSCHWIVNGSVNITPSNKPTRTLDYGSGNCDRFATVTINGVIKNIILH